MKRPVCSICNKPMGAAGGVIGIDIRFWKCWDCGEEIEDGRCEVIDSQELTGY